VVAKFSQTISFPTPATRAFAQSPFAPAATATSGLTVLFSSTTPGVCTGTNTTSISLVGTGTCTLVASQPGDAVWSAAATVTKSFSVVTKLSQTITFAAITAKTLDLPPFTVSPTASSGLPVTITTTTPAVCSPGGTNGTTITLIGVGTCTLNANQA